MAITAPTNEQLLFEVAHAVESVLTSQAIADLWEAFRCTDTSVRRIRLAPFVACLQTVVAPLAETGDPLADICTPANFTAWFHALEVRGSGWVRWSDLEAALSIVSTMRKRPAEYDKRHLASVVTSEKVYFPGGSRAIWVPEWRRSIVVCNSNAVRVCCADGTAEVLLERHISCALNAAYLAPLGVLLTMGCDRAVYMWDHRKPVALTPCLTGLPQPATAACFDVKRRRIWIALQDGFLYAYDANLETQLLRSQDKHSDWITDLIFVEDVGVVVSTSLDRSVGIWDTERGQLQVRNLGHSRGVHKVSYIRHNRVIASCGQGREICVWNPFSLEGAPVQVLLGHERDVTSLMVDVCYPCMTSADLSGRVIVWDTGRFVKLQVLELGLIRSERDLTPIFQVIQSPVNRELYLYTTAHVYRVPSTLATHCMPKLGHRVRFVVAMHAVKVIVAVLQQSLNVFDMVDGTLLVSMERPYGPVAKVQFVLAIEETDQLLVRTDMGTVFVHQWYRPRPWPSVKACAPTPLPIQSVPSNTGRASSAAANEALAPWVTARVVRATNYTKRHEVWSLVVVRDNGLCTVENFTLAVERLPAALTGGTQSSSPGLQRHVWTSIPRQVVWRGRVTLPVPQSIPGEVVKRLPAGGGVVSFTGSPHPQPGTDVTTANGVNVSVHVAAVSSAGVVLMAASAIHPSGAGNTTCNSSNAVEQEDLFAWDIRRCGSRSVVSESGPVAAGAHRRSVASASWDSTVWWDVVPRRFAGSSPTALHEHKVQVIYFVEPRHAVLLLRSRGFTLYGIGSFVPLVDWEMDVPLRPLMSSLSSSTNATGGSGPTSSSLMPPATAGGKVVCPPPFEGVSQMMSVTANHESIVVPVGIRVLQTPEDMEASAIMSDPVARSGLVMIHLQSIMSHFFAQQSAPIGAAASNGIIGCEGGIVGADAAASHASQRRAIESPDLSLLEVPTAECRFFKVTRSDMFSSSKAVIHEAVDERTKQPLVVKLHLDRIRYDHEVQLFHRMQRPSSTGDDASHSSLAALQPWVVQPVFMAVPQRYPSEQGHASNPDRAESDRTAPSTTGHTTKKMKPIVLECGEAWLKDWVQPRQAPPTQAERDLVVNCLVRMVACLHDCGLASQDLRPRSFVRVGDLWKYCGVDSLLSDGAPHSERLSAGYCPPELAPYMRSAVGEFAYVESNRAEKGAVRRPPPITQSMNMWTVAVVAWEVQMGRRLFPREASPADDGAGMTVDVAASRRKNQVPIPATFSYESVAKLGQATNPKAEAATFSNFGYGNEDIPDPEALLDHLRQMVPIDTVAGVVVRCCLLANPAERWTAAHVKEELDALGHTINLHALFQRPSCFRSGTTVAIPNELAPSVVGVAVRASELPASFEAIPLPRCEVLVASSGIPESSSVVCCDRDASKSNEGLMHLYHFNLTVPGSGGRVASEHSVSPSPRRAERAEVHPVTFCGSTPPQEIGNDTSSSWKWPIDTDIQLRVEMHAANVSDGSGGDAAQSQTAAAAAAGGPQADNDDDGDHVGSARSSPVRSARLPKRLDSDQDTNISTDAGRGMQRPLIARPVQQMELNPPSGWKAMPLPELQNAVLATADPVCLSRSVAEVVEVFSQEASKRAQFFRGGQRDGDALPLYAPDYASLGSKKLPPPGSVAAAIRAADAKDSAYARRKTAKRLEELRAVAGLSDQPRPKPGKSSGLDMRFLLEVPQLSSVKNNVALDINLDIERMFGLQSSEFDERRSPTRFEQNATHASIQKETVEGARRRYDARKRAEEAQLGEVSFTDNNLSTMSSLLRSELQQQLLMPAASYASKTQGQTDHGSPCRSRPLSRAGDGNTSPVPREIDNISALLSMSRRAATPGVGRGGALKK